MAAIKKTADEPWIVSRTVTEAPGGLLIEELWDTSVEGCPIHPWQASAVTHHFIEHYEGLNGAAE